MIQSALSIGAVVGLLVANIIADNFGKKTALIVTQLSAILGTGRTSQGYYSQLNRRHLWIIFSTSCCPVLLRVQRLLNDVLDIHVPLRMFR